MKRLALILLTCLMCSFIGNEPKTTPLQYIEKYKNLAVLEMHRTGIPASITMAQGMLESRYGNSRLATEGNNHFGIKCKKSWTGRTIIEDDDEANECFRAYDSAYLSYIDHSEFLMSNQRYAFLFEYKNTDYKNWAYGLKKAGYATNPKYPQLLLNIIERHELHKLDELEPEDLKIKEAPKPKDPQPETPKKNDQNEGGKLIFNDIPAVRAQPDDNIVKLAKRNDMGAWQIRRYNDLPRDYQLTPGEILYLKPKKRKGSAPYHVVQPGETMWSISQMYGIKLKHLYRKNRLSRRRAEQPLPGQQLNMRSKTDDAPMTKEDGAEQVTEKKVILPQNTASPEEKISPSPKEETPKDNKQEKPEVPKTKTDQPKPVFSDKPILTPKEVKDTAQIPREKVDPAKHAQLHEVKKDESLFDIALRYSMNLEDLMELNGKTNYTIQAGVQLVINPQKSPKEELDLFNKSYFHTVEAGQTLYSISRVYNIPIAKLKQMNSLATDQLSIGQKLYLFQSQVISINQVSTEPQTHKVQKGDTLYSISRKYGIGVEALKELNKLTDNAIQIGQELKLR